MHTDPYTSFENFYSTYLPQSESPAPVRKSGVGKIVAGGLRRLSTSFRRTEEEPSSGLISLEAGGEQPWLDRMLANPLACATWREKLAKREGTECLEFLLACRCFDDAGNALQRYQQMDAIVHRFVRVGAERPLPLPDVLRKQVMAEWALWARESRLPAGAKLQALTAAATVIHDLVRAEGPFNER